MVESNQRGIQMSQYPQGGYPMQPGAAYMMGQQPGQYPMGQPQAYPIGQPYGAPAQNQGRYPDGSAIPADVLAAVEEADKKEKQRLEKNPLN